MVWMTDAQKRSARVAALIARDGPDCFYCGAELVPPPNGDSGPYRGYASPSDYSRHQTLDHWIPKEKGGTSAIENLRLACYWCNHKKGARSGEELIADKGFKEHAKHVAAERSKRNGVHPTGFGYWHPGWHRINLDGYYITACSTCGREAESHADALPLFPCVVFTGRVALLGEWQPRKASLIVHKPRPAPVAQSDRAIAF